ncbi:MAG TPA: hypothetical protein VFN10_18125 [Thermoanaerobaculia bacterium]|nr:hypothetical protein [Thermoanaerobaculia bacterium]
MRGLAVVICAAMLFAAIGEIAIGVQACACVMKAPCCRTGAASCPLNSRHPSFHRCEAPPRVATADARVEAVLPRAVVTFVIVRATSYAVASVRPLTLARRPVTPPPRVSLS